MNAYGATCRRAPAEVLYRHRCGERNTSTCAWHAVQVGRRDILNAVADEKPKIYQGGRDMVLSLGAILVVMVLTVAFTGMCSFGKDDKEHVPPQRADISTFLSLEAQAMSFPVRDPGAIDEWIPTSARRQTFGNDPAPTVGWVVRGESYVQLTQTGLRPKEAIDGASEDDPLEPTGEHTVAGLRVSEYAGERAVWLVDLGNARAIVTGAAEPSDFDTLIERLAAAKPIAKR